jgi:hypothetical protein
MSDEHEDDLLAAEEVARGDVDYAAADPEALAAASQETAAGEGVGEPGIELQPDGADLDTRNEDAY